MKTDISHLCVTEQHTIRQVMACIDEASKGIAGIAIVVDEHRRFLRTLTDGDLRRAMLRGVDLNCKVVELTKSRESITAPVGTSRDEQLEIMLQAGIRHLPLLNFDRTIAELAVSDEFIAQPMDLQAVIMAGGFGTRLRPLTDHMPKPMLSVGGKPLMERTIQSLQKAGINRINVTTHFMPEKIIQHFGGGQQFGVELNYVSEEQPLGTAGALRLISEVEEPLLVMNGDILTNIDFRSLVRFHRERNALLTVAVRQYEMQVPYGVVEAVDGVISAIREKPRVTFFVNAGIYLLEPAAVKYIPSEGRYDMTDLISRLLKHGETVVGFPVMEYWLDIGKHDDFQKAQEDVEQVRWAA